MLRPLFQQVVPGNFRLSEEWKSKLRECQPAHVRLDDEVFGLIQEELAWLVETTGIIKLGADKKAVIDRLNVIRRRSLKLVTALCEKSDGKSGKETNSDLAKDLSEALVYPCTGDGEAVNAQRIALDYLEVDLAMQGFGAGPYSAVDVVALSLQTLNPMLGVYGKIDPKVLCRAIHDLQRVCDRTIDLLTRTNDELAKRLSPLEGKIIINDRPFKFRPDPWREPRTRVLGNARRESVGRLAAIYQWAGGRAFVHKDGRNPNARPPTPFMRFLGAVNEALPEHARVEGDKFYSQARAVRSKIS